MTKFNRTTIAQKLNAAQLAISNSLADPVIMTAVAEYGFSAAKLEEGMLLYQDALNRVNTSLSGRGDQKTATADLKAKEKEARDAFQAAAQVSRAALDSNRRTALGLTGSAPRTTASFIQAGYTLFDNMASNGLLTDFGYDAARIKAERAKIEEYDRANRAQEAAKGNSQQATQDQLAALNKMNDWLLQYLKIAKVALRGNKQLLEKIGLMTRTSKTAGQRAAPAKAAATRAAKKVKTEEK